MNGLDSLVFTKQLIKFLFVYFMWYGFDALFVWLYVFVCHITQQLRKMLPFAKSIQNIAVGNTLQVLWSLSARSVCVWVAFYSNQFAYCASIETLILYTHSTICVMLAILYTYTHTYRPKAKGKHRGNNLASKEVAVSKGAYRSIETKVLVTDKKAKEGEGNGIK